jgi:hypothetical protein
MDLQGAGSHGLEGVAFARVTDKATGAHIQTRKSVMTFFFVSLMAIFVILSRCCRQSAQVTGP